MTRTEFHKAQYRTTTTTTATTTLLAASTSTSTAAAITKYSVYIESVMIQSKYTQLDIQLKYYASCSIRAARALCRVCLFVCSITLRMCVNWIDILPQFEFINDTYKWYRQYEQTHHLVVLQTPHTVSHRDRENMQCNSICYFNVNLKCAWCDFSVCARSLSLSLSLCRSICGAVM